MSIRLTINGLSNGLKKLDEMAARMANMGPALVRFCEYHVRKTRRIVDAGERGIRTLHRASGLSASITYHVEGNAWREGSNKEYAASQQFGPRGGFYESSRPGGYLAIPIADNLGARDAKYGSPRELKNAMFIRTGDPEQLLVVTERTKKRAAPGEKRTRIKAPRLNSPGIRAVYNVWFLLVKRARGKAHRYCTFEPEDRQQWETIGRRYIETGRA